MQTEYVIVTICNNYVQVRLLPEVDYIEEEGIATGTQDTNLLWYLDRPTPDAP